MINVFSATETAFTSNGLAILAPISAIVRERLNDAYSLTARFTQDDAVYLVEDRVLQANSPYGPQLFRISEITATLDGNVEVYALHKFYDLADFFIEDVYPTAKDGQEALDIILAGTTEAHAFTGYSDITIIQNARIELKSPVTALLQASEDNCYLNRWGGEIERDNHVVRMLTRKGADRGVQIRYRKNLTGLTAKTDMKTVVTRIMPTGLYEDDTLLELAAKYVDSANIGLYKNIKIVRVHYTDVKVSAAVDALYPTEAAARAELQARAEALFAAGCDLPTMSLDVQLIALADTAEYAQYSALEAIYLGDTVDVIHEPLNVDVSLRLTEYEYDCELQRYVRLTIGDLPENIGTSVIDAGIDISALKNIVEQTTLKQGQRYNAVRIDHTDGFVAECAALNSKMVANGEHIGYYDLTTGAFLGGLANIDGIIALIAKRISNVDDLSNYAEVGTVPGGGQGLSLMASAVNYFRAARLADNGFAFLDMNAVQRIAVNGDGSTTLADGAGHGRFVQSVAGDTTLLDAANHVRFWQTAAGDSYIYDATGQLRFLLDAAGNTVIYDAANHVRLYQPASGDTYLYDNDGHVILNSQVAGNFTQMHVPSATDNATGVDATGGYDIVAGVKIYR